MLYSYPCHAQHATDKADQLIGVWLHPELVTGRLLQAAHHVNSRLCFWFPVAPLACVWKPWNPGGFFLVCPRKTLNKVHNTIQRKPRRLFENLVSLCPNLHPYTIAVTDDARPNMTLPRTSASSSPRQLDDCISKCLSAHRTIIRSDTQTLRYPNQHTYQTVTVTATR